MAKDDIKWFPRIQVSKWNPETVAAATKEFGHEPGFDELMQFTGYTPDGMAFAEGNELTTAGLHAITGLLIGAGGQAFNAANAIIGVGATNTAFATNQTALAGNGNASTAWYQGADNPSGLPSRSNGAISASATFGGSDANFAWNEWCWATGTGTITPAHTLANVTAGTEVMWNRKVASLGTKASGAQWTLSATVTLT